MKRNFILMGLFLLVLFISIGIIINLTLQKKALKKEIKKVKEEVSCVKHSNSKVILENIKESNKYFDDLKNTGYPFENILLELKNKGMGFSIFRGYYSHLRHVKGYPVIFLNCDGLVSVRIFIEDDSSYMLQKLNSLYKGAEILVSGKIIAVDWIDADKGYSLVVSPRILIKR
jgi:hypothetical protein